MLQSLREQSGKWFVKILFGAIVASFGIWGIGDVVRNYTSLRPVAKVGKTSISYDEFAFALQKEISRLQQITKGQVTSSQLKKMNIHKQVLDQMIDREALDLELERLGLAVSDVLIKNQIQSVPHFQHDGVFSRALFEDILRSNGISEKTFIDEARKTLLMRQLFGSLLSGAHLPRMYKGLLLKGLSEQKVFTVVSVPLKKMQSTGTPSDEELQNIYNHNKGRYAVPEFRKTTFILLDIKTLGKNTTLSEQEIKDEYEKRIESLSIPEKRTVKSLTYLTAAQAEDALKRLKAGRPISAVGRDVPGGDLADLGSVEKSQLPEAAQEKVFALKAGESSSVINVGTDFTVYQVTKIDLAHVKTLEEVLPSIKEDLFMQKSEGRIQEIKNKIEDAIAGGAKLSDVAKEFNLSIESVPSFNVQGLDEQGKPVLTALEPEVKKSILDQAFRLNEGAESPITDVGYVSFVVQVEAVKPALIPELSAIKDKVAKDWDQEKKFQQAAELANQISQEAKTLSDLTKLADKHGLTLTSNHTLSRSDIGEKSGLKDEATKALISSFGADLVGRMFQLGVDRSTYGVTKDGFAVVMLQKVNPYTPNKKNAENFAKSIDQMSEKTLSELILDSFRTDHTVSINQETFDYVVSQE